MWVKHRHRQYARAHTYSERAGKSKRKTKNYRKENRFYHLLDYMIFHHLCQQKIKLVLLGWMTMNKKRAWTTNLPHRVNWNENVRRRRRRNFSCKKFDAFKKIWPTNKKNNADKKLKIVIIGMIVVNNVCIGDECESHNSKWHQEEKEEQFS